MAGRPGYEDRHLGQSQARRRKQNPIYCNYPQIRNQCLDQGRRKDRVAPGGRPRPGYLRPAYKCRKGQVKILTADFSDAFLNLAVKRSERRTRQCGHQDGFWSICSIRACCLWLATAPLLAGRAAAWLGRSAQALHRLQIYVDDPALVACGNRSQRTWTFARALLF